MKHVLAWTTRSSGSAAENEAAEVRLLEVFSKWTPSPDATIHQFVLRIDGQGGFAVVETDNPADTLKELAIFAPFNEYTIYPVIDIAEGVQAMREAVEFRASVK
jgi:Domain of unknown function (DUF3303)